MPARVLLIEDNKANLDLMRYLLEAFGYTVLTAMDGSDGLAMVAEHVPDLIVCDIQMPKIDGYEVSRRLEQDAELRSIPRIAVSALAMVGDRDRILLAGFHGYIAKPIVPETFVEQLEANLPTALRVDGRPTRPGSPMTSNVEAPTAIRATILILDDVPNNLAVLRSVLEPSGYRIVSASNTSEAIALTREHSIDLFLSDLHLPGETQFELLHHLRSHSELKHLPFVFISSTTKSQLKKQEALNNGANKFLFRPIAPQILLAELNESLVGSAAV